MELADRNPYLCDSSTTRYGHPTIGHLDGDSAGRHDLGMKGADCIYNCDPMPFGD
jgi:hypothetical protein